MTLTLVAMPIGNVDDITVRALKVLRSAEIILGEEPKQLRYWLATYDLHPESTGFINEHTRQQMIDEYAALSLRKRIVLVSDAGTPGFCDPGAELVAACHKLNVEVDAVPGASSLMFMLSLAGIRLASFMFRGFLPRDSLERETAWRHIEQSGQASVVMDTPYRLQKTLREMKHKLGRRSFFLGINLTQADQKLVWGSADTLDPESLPDKAEFCLLIYPKQDPIHAHRNRVPRRIAPKSRVSMRGERS